ncbi:MAG: hypothetical protein ACJAZO_004816 [Myxococcota bacterium]|jgi:uncharacterized protein YjbI with pentapeptide repeats
MGLLELLQAGDVDTFNTTRGERTRLEFFAADLPGLDLSRVDLNGANIEKADLTGTKLVGASLFRARFTGIDGTEMDLTDCLGQRSKFADAWLESAVIEDAEFSQANFSEAYLKGTKGAGVRFSKAKLTDVDATECVWPMADLSEASMHKANFTKADLGQADFTDANATGADFTDAKLDGVLGSRARFQGAILVRTSLVAARLDEANLAGADLSGADLSGADLTGANLEGAILTGATMTGAVLANAVLEDVDFTGLQLVDVDLTGVDPAALGLSEEQLAQVAAVGSTADLNAPLVLDDVRAAANGETVLLFWENADSEAERSLRWVLCKGEITKGILPMGADGILAKAVVPKGDGFELIVLQDRPGGCVCLAIELGPDGATRNSRNFPLGYTPVLTPIVRSDGKAVLITGMARRGPTLVVQRLDDEGLTPVHSERIATARGFLGRHSAVVACKGDVWMAVDRNGSSRPLGSPDGFPGMRGVAAPVSDAVCAVWAVAPTKRVPGVLMASMLVKRGAPFETKLAPITSVSALDIVVVGQEVWVAWANQSEDGLAVFRCRVGGDPAILPVPYNNVRDVLFASDTLDSEGVPCVLVTSRDGRGTVLGQASILGVIEG